MTLVYFVITLGILIFIHELGHFILAKRAGIRVDAFSLGFGPRLFGVKIGETDYRVSALPLGGYVRMLGEDPADEGASDPRSFSSKGIIARAKAVASGPMMNLLLCFVLMPIVFMIGRSEPVYLHEAPVLIDVEQESPAGDSGLMKGDLIKSIDGKEVSTWEDVINQVLVRPDQEIDLVVERDGEEFALEVTAGELPEIKGGYLGIEPILFLGNEARVDGIQIGGPAYLAGMQEGDIVMEFAGRPVKNFYDLSAKVNSFGGRETKITVKRGSEILELPIKPSHSVELDRWIIGITKSRQSIGGPEKVYRYDFSDAVIMGAKENLKLARLTFDVLYRLVTLKLSYKILGGPIIIAKVSAEAAASGLSHFLYFMAFMSLQLSILNILPIPILDGGHLLFLGMEAILKRPVSIRVRHAANQVGFAIVIAFMALITLKDVNSVLGITYWIKKAFE